MIDTIGTNVVNDKCDATSYESCSYKRKIYDLNLLYESFLKSKKGSSWKEQVQKFGILYLSELAQISNKLQDRTFEFSDGIHFILHERGKTRYITGEQIQDRVVKHALCDEVLNPAILPHLIYDNGASIPGKGISFTRKRLLTHLHRYYQRHGSNEGYILLIDFSKYYDNLRHDVIRKLVRQYVDDEDALWLLNKVLEKSRIDVSYMTDEEYSRCMNEVFNSLEYQKIDKSLLTGEKFMDKHMDIGDQVSQTMGIAYRIPIDNYVKIVKGVKEYGGYQDDTYVIHESKEFLEDLLKDIIEIAKQNGITVNTKKTRICKLSDWWSFLQLRYTLTDTGKVPQKINPKRLTAMRRRMKSRVKKCSLREFRDMYRSWFNSNYKYMSKLQRKNLDELYSKLFEERAEELERIKKEREEKEKAAKKKTKAKTKKKEGAKECTQSH